jgi:hypothetical protein
MIDSHRAPELDNEDINHTGVFAELISSLLSAEGAQRPVALPLAQAAPTSRISPAS